MFPLIPALILLLLHGPSNFERLAESGRLPTALAAFHQEATPAQDRAVAPKEEVSRRVLASIIAATGDRALSEAFASMFMAGDPRPVASPLDFTNEPTEPVSIAEAAEVKPPNGFLHCVRSRDGPAAA